MARLYKRPESKTLWWCDIRWRGQKIREPAGKTRQKAQDYLDQRLADLRNEEALPSHKRPAFTVEDLKTLWLESARAEKKKSLAADRARFEGLLAILGPRTQVDTIEPADIDRLVKQLRSGKHNGGRKLAEPTVNRYLALLRSALNEARRHKKKHRDPMRDFVMARERGRKRTPTAAELERLLDAADLDLKAAIVLAHETGMRLGEISKMKRSWVDGAGRMVRLPGSQTKSGEERRVPLSRTAAATIEALPTRLDGRILGIPGDVASNRFHRLCEKLKIQDLRFHDLRRAAATNLRRAGVDLATIADILGHSSLAMVKRYQLITDEDKLAAVDAVALR